MAGLPSAVQCRLASAAPVRAVQCKWTAAKSLGLARVPVILVDYLVDEGVLVDVWPDCGRESIAKTEVLEMGVSGDLFPPKTSCHTLPFKIPSISIPLSDLEN